jgi:hypothetical protein
MIDEITVKGSLSTSDQEMINLLSDMKSDIEELLALYLRYPDYKKLEQEEPETLDRLSNTPGGSLVRFAIGSVFDNILNKKFYAKVKKLIAGKNGAISAYLDNLAIEQFQQTVSKNIKKEKEQKPELFNEIRRFIIKNV